MSYNENTLKVTHKLSDIQIECLNIHLREIDNDFFDISGRSLVDSETFIFECFKNAFTFTKENPESIDDKDNLTYRSYRYLRSFVSSFDEDIIKSEFKIFMKTFKFSSEIFIQTLKEAREEFNSTK